MLARETFLTSVYVGCCPGTVGLLCFAESLECWLGKNVLQFLLENGICQYSTQQFAGYAQEV